MEEEEIHYDMTHYQILSHYYSIYYSNLNFDLLWKSAYRSNYLKNDGSREPLEKPKKPFFFMLLILFFGVSFVKVRCAVQKYMVLRGFHVYKSVFLGWVVGRFNIAANGEHNCGVAPRDTVTWRSTKHTAVTSMHVFLDWLINPLECFFRHAALDRNPGMGYNTLHIPFWLISHLKSAWEAVIGPLTTQPSWCGHICPYLTCVNWAHHKRTLAIVYTNMQTY